MAPSEQTPAQRRRRVVDEAARRALRPAISYPPELPIAARRADLLAAIEANQVVIVAGETGSGKTTQLPKLCLELGRGIAGTIAHTQPRRIAARAAAERVAAELGVELGGAVGYAVRFDERAGADTLVRFLTDGLLLAEIQRDRELRRYDTIIVDEAHERSLNIDFLLGYLTWLLPRRPELRLIVASATIDAAQLSRHFGGAPVVEVSGRMYPVEVRYRALEEGSDPTDAVADAVAELLADGPGDVLVFQSGEREIRDTAELLRGRLGGSVEILPLFARLAHDEQRRVFAAHRGRRVVLATNVAETSLTVPGIGAVVDPGTARISRYSGRLKVQRLPIEPISKASADQRKGRCGRTRDGICIRLYGEDDFAARPDFTEPEILRTGLASVLLQMAALGLGDPADFGFIDPPDRRQIRDGVALLEELGAFAEGRLTGLGRRLARLPVDPRLGRMVLEAGRLECADEVIAIVAALSIQEPRERPHEERAAADEAHARLADPQSDFLSFLRLWRHLRDGQRALSASQFRKRCKAEFLHYLRVREWEDLAAQLRTAARAAGVAINREPAAPEAIHRAILAGLLSQIGLRNAARRDYDGPRGARFALFPGSALRGRAPAWVMVAELVETERLWGRTAARVNPRWIEAQAAHLLVRSYDDQRWDAARGTLVATERATLYGLPVVAGRVVAYDRIDPSLARERFIRHALLDGDWRSGGHAFVERNAALVASVRELEHRTRRRDILVGDETIYDFFDARIPPGVVSAASFERWWSRQDGAMLDFTRERLVDPAAAAGADPRAHPERWRHGELSLGLRYRFDPGAEDDGVTVEVPLDELAALRDEGFDWLVPGLREELIVALIRALPKELRRPLVPIPALAAEIAARLSAADGRPLVVALAAEIELLRGVAVAPEAFDRDRLAPHLRMTFRVLDESGATLAEDADLERLRTRLEPRLRAALDTASAGIERHGATRWEFGTLPRSLAGGTLRAYPALIDEGDAVGVAALETPAAQAAAMWTGTRRLLALTLPSPARAALRALDGPATLTLAAAPHGSVEAVLADARGAALDSLIDEPAWSAEEFARLRARVAGPLAGRTTAILRAIVAVLSVRAALHRRLAELAPFARFEPARLDVATQLGTLVFPGFATATGAARLPDVERYLRAALRRLERLPDAVAEDADRMRTLHELERAHRAARSPDEEVAWMLQELRVSQFAQDLGVRGPISAKRVRRALAALTVLLALAVTC